MRFDYRSMSVAAGLVLAGVAAAGLAGPRQVDRAAAVMRLLIADRGAVAATTRLLEAAARDDPQAEFDLGVLCDAAAKMTAAEIAAAERMAGAWRPSNPGLRL